MSNNRKYFCVMVVFSITAKDRNMWWKIIGADEVKTKAVALQSKEDSAKIIFWAPQLLFERRKLIGHSSVSGGGQKIGHILG